MRQGAPSSDRPLLTGLSCDAMPWEGTYPPRTFWRSTALEEYLSVGQRGSRPPSLNGIWGGSEGCVLGLAGACEKCKR